MHIRPPLQKGIFFNVASIINAKRWGGSNSVDFTIKTSFPGQSSKNIAWVK
jgi:hypothetical protein